jgi:hypothetical protein
MNDDVPGEWLSVPEAAAKLGTTEGGIRGRINRRTLRHRKGNDGKLTVFVPDNAADERQITADDTADILRQERDDAREQAERWRVQAETARIDAASKAAEAAAKDILIGELKALLAAERERATRPWWRRLLGP